MNYKTFANPPANFSPGYFWCLNAEMDHEVLFGQLHDMYDHGVRSVCLHPVPPVFDAHGSMSPKYLSPEYMQIIKELVDECARLGMNYYLYDEGGFPSGGACGQVYESDPKKYAIHKWFPDGPGKVKLVEEKFTSRPPLPDLLVPGATEKFIELTHEAHKKLVQKHFGKTIKFAFTDEPQMPRSYLEHYLTWTADFAEQFKKRKGYDIVPHLPMMLQTASVVRDANSVIRIDFYDVCAQLFVERYLLPIRDWCRKNNLLSGGHFGGEEELSQHPFAGFGFMLRSLRALDFPGVDMIWRQLYPGLRLHPFPKYASSIANQAGRQQVLGEMFAVYGAGLKPFAMKFLIDYMLLCGVNTFVFSNIAQRKKDGQMAGCRPLFGATDILWDYFPQFHGYVNRMAWLFAQGKAVADTAVLFDDRSLCFSYRFTEYALVRHEWTSRKLMEKRVGFDFVDSDVLETAKLSKGKLVIDKMRYSRLMITNGSILSPKAEARLEEFRKAGVEVVSEEAIDDMPSLVNTVPATTRLFAQKRILSDGTALYMLLNTTAIPVEVDIEFQEKAPVAYCDGETGSFYRIKSNHWVFAPYSSASFCVGEAMADCEPMPAGPAKVTQSLESWTIRPIRESVAGEHTYEFRQIKKQARKASLGDWRRYLGDEFSGDVVYATEFTCGKTADCAFLDLGDVKYAAKVRLNGQEIGFRLFGPYVFDLRPALKKGQNKLEITVTNTLANMLSSPKLLETWIRKYPPLSPYEITQRTFEKDSLESGLYGPVTLRSAARAGK